MTCYAGGYCPKCKVPVCFRGGRPVDARGVYCCPSCGDPAPKKDNAGYEKWPQASFRKSGWFVTRWTFVRDLSEKPTNPAKP